MSVVMVLQALGWVSVVALVTVHVLIQHGRLPENGRAYRIAGCAAAVSVVAASAAEKIWPVAVLGLLWLRIEVFGHRHHHPEYRPESPSVDDSVPPPAREQMPPMLVGSLSRQTPPAVPQESQPGSHPHLPHPHLPHPHLPHPHLPHPHLGRRTVDRVFKVEMGIVIVIALVFFGIWAEQQRASFTSTTDYVVCNWIDGC